MNRRAVLSAVGTASLAGIAGCAFGQSEEPPAGSLRFVNDDERVPHSITMRITDVGTEPGEGPHAVTGQTTAPPAQRTLTASTTLEPGASETYASVFTEPVWYAITFTVDGEPPANDGGRVVYSPVPDGKPDGRMLLGTIGRGGDFRWGIRATDNPGTFDL